MAGGYNAGSIMGGIGEGLQRGVLLGMQLKQQKMDQAKVLLAQQQQEIENEKQKQTLENTKLDRAWAQYDHADTPGIKMTIYNREIAPILGVPAMASEPGAETATFFAESGDNWALTRKKDKNGQPLRTYDEARSVQAELTGKHGTILASTPGAVETLKALIPPAPEKPVAKLADEVNLEQSTALLKAGKITAQEFKFRIGALPATAFESTTDKGLTPAMKTAKELVSGGYFDNYPAEEKLSQAFEFVTKPPQSKADFLADQIARFTDQRALQPMPVEKATAEAEKMWTTYNKYTTKLSTPSTPEAKTPGQVKKPSRLGSPQGKRNIQMFKQTKTVEEALALQKKLLDPKLGWTPVEVDEMATAGGWSVQ